MFMTLGLTRVLRPLLVRTVLFLSQCGQEDCFLSNETDLNFERFFLQVVGSGIFAIVLSLAK